MSKKKAERYRRERSDEIVKLKNLLSQDQDLFGFDPYGSLNAAADQCKSEQLPYLPDWDFHASATSWGYQCDQLVFPVYKPSSQLQPASARGNEVRIQIDLVLVGRSDARQFEDPLFVLEMDIQIEGRGDNGDLLGAWHLDKHKGGDDDPPRSAHPEYHMQYGGKNLWGEVDDYGGLIIPEPPRLSHPPMDVILAVDFVLSNFFWQRWRRLREDSVYIDLVSTAQERLWKPYTEALSKAWSRGSYENEVWPANQIWPQLNKRVGL